MSAQPENRQRENSNAHTASFSIIPVPRLVKYGCFAYNKRYLAGDTEAEENMKRETQIDIAAAEATGSDYDNACK
ncbi:MAG TPA: hypothetical protein DCZ40_04920, partial [Lachnospiraceae bacterium]|nr:hypothetical protein [Lachnospiraceae bacterium]